MKPQIYEPQRDVVHTIDCNIRSIDEFRAHFHQSVEISYMISGSTEFHVGTGSYELSPGQITFVPEYVVHYTLKANDCDGNTLAAVLIVPKKYYEKFAAFTDNAAFSYLPDTEKNKEIGEYMIKLANAINTSSEFVVRAYTDLILGLIAEKYEPAKVGGGNNDLMAEVIRYVDEHYNEKLTLDGLAAHFGYSKYYFSRLFNRTFNCSLTSYVNSVRARAVDEKHGSGKKTDIIIESGFGTLSSYYRTVK